MSTVTEQLREAFENSGYDVGEVSQNRDSVRVAVMEEGAEADQVRAIVTDTLDEESVLGLNVTTESVEGQDAVQTVVSFRHRD